MLWVHICVSILSFVLIGISDKGLSALYLRCKGGSTLVVFDTSLATRSIYSVILVAEVASIVFVIVRQKHAGGSLLSSVCQRQT